MSQVNVTALRQRLHDYLARVARGERVRVTSHGRVIAELTPPTPDRNAGDAARARLRGTLVRYDAPLEPVLPAEEWEMNR